MDITIRVAGEAGQGVQTTGNLLVESLAQLGMYVVSTQSYMSRIRGGLNWFDVRAGDQPLLGGSERADLLIALTEQAVAILQEHTTENALILYDGEQCERDGVICIPFTKIAKETSHSPVMANVVAAGSVLTLLDLGLKDLEGYLERHFQKKGPEVVAQNIACAREGAKCAARIERKLGAPRRRKAPANLIAGAEALGLGAATAGLKCVFAYPMTPSTATMTYLAGVSDRYGIVVEQAEDEIAALNMACGAAFAGAPALVTTSGGGFALMVEALSLAGMCELPVVVVLAQRPGPATGQPTRTAQQDLLFAIHAGHGEFPRAVYAPGTVRQCYDIARQALATAHKYQTPAIILTDQFLQDLQQNISPLDAALRPIDCRVVEGGDDYARYALTDSGVSPRAIPGGPAAVIVDSDEHDHLGHLSESFQVRMAQQDKRLRKGRGLTNEALAPELVGPEDARTLLIAWGSTYGPCREAVERLNEQGGSFAMLHFAQVWPLDAKAAARHLRADRRMVSVEGNSTALFASLLRSAGLPGPTETLLRYDGQAFTSDYIVSRIQE
ncbi:MAG: 2-oxoglutarate oxidoreductase subunit KorA [Planctomycetes bacterium ADurb.Bin126]|nr:MAG: 2-oxoglutarate oxidoreductase subunit KorA [Planctomycetes bacterium ADurb.Bin126]HOD81883.1 2-oxoacid:acceptor oxidoreductase subunit alpha [Phycisphaerae bacterium]HQL74596.1 2-oxoacid:acceptor oxidoreductase subunit alpha [Phycisphaerae bacterium]